LQITQPQRLGQLSVNWGAETNKVKLFCSSNG
jgi:hypothetical protein